MAAAQVQLGLTQSEHGTLDEVIRPHLRLEPREHVGNAVSAERDPSSPAKGQSITKRSVSQPADNKHKHDKLSASKTILQSTVESDNKRRPIVLRRNSRKYNPPSPEHPDPNSEAKSATIRRMQNNLEDWNKQLKEIMDKKERDDAILQSEVEKRDAEIEDLKKKYSAETKLRIKVEKKRDNLVERLKNTEGELDQHKQQLEQFQNQLAEYELAYEQLDSRRVELEEELQATGEQLQQSETMRRRLNDHVTELQGQLAIEEQRSKFCIIQ